MPPKPPSFEDHLVHPEVLSLIRAVLTRLGVRAQDLGDGSQSVMVLALRWKGQRPETLDGTKGVCITIARRYGVSLLRSRKRHEATFSPTALETEMILAPTPEIDLDRVDLDRVLAEIEKLPAQTVEILHDIGAGVDQREIGNDLGPLGYPKTRGTAQRGRASTRSRIAAAGLAGLFVAGVTLVLIRQPGGELPTHGAPTPTPEQMKAEQLRDEAAERCAAGEYDTCLQLYVTAQTLDPEESADVAAAHDEAAARYRELMANAGAEAGPGGSAPVRPHASAKPAGSGAPPKVP